MEPKDLYVDKVLTNLSLAYRNSELIWRDVMPVTKVDKRSGIYYVRNKEDIFRVPDDQFGPGGLANEVSWSTGTRNYSVTDHGLAGWVLQEAIDAADSPIRPRATQVDVINEQLELAQEVRVASLVMNAATYPTGNKVQLSGTARFGQSADDPIGVIDTALRTTFKRANTLVMGYDVWHVLKRLPEIIEAVKSKNIATAPLAQGFVSRSEVAALFEVDRVIVGEAKRATNDLGQTEAYGYIWGKHIAALHITQGLGLDSLDFGKTMVETDKLTFTAFHGERGLKGAHYIKTAWNSDQHIIASDLGYFIEDAVA